MYERVSDTQTLRLFWQGRGDRDICSVGDSHMHMSLPSTCKPGGFYMRKRPKISQKGYGRLGSGIARPLTGCFRSASALHERRILSGSTA